MLQLVKKRLKEQKGMTLIELLAVIVILGIISAIAIPSILGLIDNSKKDAHVANARQMINSAKLAVTADKTLQPANGSSKQIKLTDLQSKGYIETVKDPDGGSYKPDDSYVQINADDTGKLSYSVFLTNGNRIVADTNDKSKPADEDSLSRDNVQKVN